VLQQLKGSAIRAAMSRDWIVRLAGRARAAEIAAGLDPQIAAVLEYQRLARLPAIETLTPVAARAFAERSYEPAELPLQPMAHVIDTAAGEQRTPVRIYVPHDAGHDWLVWFHGGGGVIGSIAGADRACRYLAARTAMTVASVGYRLAPEDKHPAAIEDACTAWEVLAARAPAGARVVVGGDSFGGFLTAHVDRWSRHAGVRRPDAQVLLYPVIDLRLVSPSIERLSDGYVLTRSTMHWFRDHYFDAADDPAAASPHLWDEVTDAAPAIIVTAGFDPLVDDGHAWVDRLAAAGTPVRHLEFPALIHDFLRLGGVVRAARSAIDTMCQEIVAFAPR
jgi:acetyl esterase